MHVKSEKFLCFFTNVTIKEEKQRQPVSQPYVEMDRRVCFFAIHLYV